MTKHAGSYLEFLVSLILTEISILFLPDWSNRNIFFKLCMQQFLFLGVFYNWLGLTSSCFKKLLLIFFLRFGKSFLLCTVPRILVLQLPYRLFFVLGLYFCLQFNTSLTFISRGLLGCSLSSAWSLQREKFDKCFDRLHVWWYNNR